MLCGVVDSSLHLPPGTQGSVGVEKPRGFLDTGELQRQECEAEPRERELVRSDRQLHHLLTSGRCVKHIDLCF